MDLTYIVGWSLAFLGVPVLAVAVVVLTWAAVHELRHPLPRFDDPADKE